VTDKYHREEETMEIQRKSYMRSAAFWVITQRVVVVFLPLLAA